MKPTWAKSCIAAPSMICLDLCNLEQQVCMLEDLGTEVLHVDVLDGYFSPSMPIGLDTIRQLRAKTNLLFDVHLMSKEPDFFVDELLDIGVDQLVFHLENAPHVDELLNRIKNKGVRAGVALKPATPVAQLTYILEKCDVVLLMLINPGYAGVKSEAQVPYAKRKIDELRQAIAHLGLDTRIELDGRISLQNIEEYGGDLANIFVAGSTCIDKNDMPNSIKKLHTLCAQKERPD